MKLLEIQVKHQALLSQQVNVRAHVMKVSQIHGPIFKFCVVICEVILQKMAPILDPVNFFFRF